MSTHDPLLKTELPVPFEVIFGDSVVVQDHPEHWNRESGNPAPRHESQIVASSQGFLYGLRTDNDGKPWTRLVMFKPSGSLYKLWHETQGAAGSGPIESLQIGSNFVGETRRPVYASYMSSIGKKLIGYLDQKTVDYIKEFAWKAELGSPVSIP